MENGQPTHRLVTPETCDLKVEDHGSIFLFRLRSQAGREFLDEHAPEDAQWFGLALAVEHRYANEWAQHAIDAGLRVA